jgi:hypothetical protein
VGIYSEKIELYPQRIARFYVIEKVSATKAFKQILG